MFSPEEETVVIAAMRRDDIETIADELRCDVNTAIVHVEHIAKKFALYAKLLRSGS